MCRCGLKQNLDQTVELFYASTQLPITAITNQGVAEECPLRLHGQATSQMGPAHYYEGELEFPGGLRLYACPICPHGGRAGIFLLGPYSATKKAKPPLTYRPREALPHLISFLRRLQVECATAEVETYCLHVHRAIQMIKKDYKQKISLAEAAHKLGLNKSYLSTLFREQTGRTFTEFIHEVRIDASKELLRESTLSVLEVALQVGFSSQNYFTRIFKKLTGKTPSEFRRRIGQLV